jgi:hypothetical protein
MEATSMIKSLVGFCLLLLGSTGCTITLPEKIYTSQVKSGFKDLDNNSAVQEGLVADAETCASRLNRERSRAGTYNGVRVTVTAVGGVTSGVGGVVSAIEDDKDAKRNAAIVAAIGGGVALAGTFLTSLIGDPSDQLDRHAKGLSSWESARTKADQARRTPSTGAEHERLIRDVQSDLRSCQRDERPVGAGAPTNPGPAVGE